MGVALSGDIAQPEALLAVFVLDVEDVVSIGRNGRERGFAGFGDGRNREGFESLGFFVIQKGVDAEGGGGDEREENDEK